MMVILQKKFHRLRKSEPYGAPEKTSKKDIKT